MAALGGNSGQVENAAEVGIEHHLGMTCDPIGGTVQVTPSSATRWARWPANAASLLRSDGAHHVSLDQAIETVRTTGADMQNKYKETARSAAATCAAGQPGGMLNTLQPIRAAH